MGLSDLVIRGAREHNLKGVDLTLPRESLVTMTGVSGSGKSSLAFDTIFKEGQRRFLESLSAYARQFVGQMEKPRVESIRGLSPTISIDQKTVNRNPRSTVGTMTEVYDYLRLMFARLGIPHCAGCSRELRAQTVDQIVASLLAEFRGERCLVLAPVVRDRKGHYRKELVAYQRKGFVRARIDGVVRRLDESIDLHRYKRHTIELVTDRVKLEPTRRHRVAEAVQAALKLAAGQCAVLVADEHHQEFSTSLSCPHCGASLPELEPRLFSFNSPHGACPKCNGLGTVRRIDATKVVPDRTRSIAAGALQIMTKTGYLPYVRLNQASLAKVAKSLGFSLADPWNTLTRKQQNALLYGSKSKLRIPFERRSSNGDRTVKCVDHRRLTGIIPGMEEAWIRSHPRHLEKYFSDLVCDECGGRRLRPEALAVRFRECSITDYADWNIETARTFFQELELTQNEQKIGEGIVRELKSRLDFLDTVGIGYLTLNRGATTLSGGEAQRVRLATQVGSGLQGVLYVLDEPSIGLHARDHGRLLGTLVELRDRRNTVLVVEHDRDTMLRSDWLVDIGPGAGALGGEIVIAGPAAKVLRSRKSKTAKYLRGEESIPVPAKRRKGSGKTLKIEGARHFNLKNIAVEIPLGVLVGVTGVSGSGKSTLVHTVLRRALARELHNAEATPGDYKKIRGVQNLDKVIEIDQSPIGRTPRSNPATYTKVWTHIRDLFALNPEAKTRGYKKGRFSFNVKGGRCEACKGAGLKTIEMQFLADVDVPCEQCNGRRFNRETLEILYRGYTVNDVLQMTIERAAEVFGNVPKVAHVLNTLMDVGLNYVSLGQPSTTLSGGEAQRVKLASELARPATGNTLYILDEPTTGLHFEDIRKLLCTLNRLVDRGNTVLVIEHNLDVVQSCDTLIDLGPEGGERGGFVVATGAPEQVARNKKSHTGRFLKRAWAERTAKPRAARRARNGEAKTLRVRGAEKNNLAKIDVTLRHDRMTVVTGVSGSGKTSLAFDTLFAEGQRRFVESLSTYARRFFSRLDRAPVERIDGLRPAIAIDQRGGVKNPRSTVATTTEIYDSLRLLFARLGQPHCPSCDKPIQAHNPTSAAADAVERFSGQKAVVAAPLFQQHAMRILVLETPDQLALHKQTLQADGFVRVLVDGKEQRLTAGAVNRRAKRIDLVVDRLRLEPSRQVRVAEALETAFVRGHGVASLWVDGKLEVSYSTRLACEDCHGFLPEELSPRHFSFNHHLGACPACEGLGKKRRAVASKVVVRPDRPLLKNALVDYPGRYFRRKSSYIGATLRAAADHLGVDLEEPFESYSPKQQQGILRGTGCPERLSVSMSRSRRGGRRSMTFQGRWRGILGEIEHWLRNAHEGKWWVDRLLALTELADCGECGGGRIRAEALAVRLAGDSIHDVTRRTVRQALDWSEQLVLGPAGKIIAEQPLAEVHNRLKFLCDVGLDYLTLDRSSGTLSGGEAQRIRLATQLGSGLVGVMYVLDEPSIGLHPRDNQRLIQTLKGLRDLGNTLVVVEHDEEMIRAADYVVDLGPGAGIQGGTVTASGTVRQIERDKNSLTGSYLRGAAAIPVPQHRRKGGKPIVVHGANQHNLQDVDVSVPGNTLTVITGVSGSGKSTLMMEVLQPAVRAHLNTDAPKPGGCRRVTGLAAIEQLVVIDQSPIGTTPSSNPATYTKVFDPIREVFATTNEAKMQGFSRSEFSFNQGQGRCSACQGRGAILVEMHFLSDLWVTCEACRGRRYNEATLAVEFKGKNIANVLAMEVNEALEFFGFHKRISRILRVLHDVGLGYLKLGQSSTTLSGGEAQRVKLAAQLARPSGEGTLVLLDEPTTGLHFADVEKLIQVFHSLVERGNSVLVIEHHLGVIKNADYVIDLGPEGGERGGRVVAAGTPEHVARTGGSLTGSFLQSMLQPRPVRRRKASSRAKSGATP